MDTWQQVRRDIAEALETSPDTLPRHDSHEWYQLLGDLQTSHPELVQRARTVLVETAAPEPLPTHAEIASERRRAGVLATLSKWAQRRDPTQPHRLRTNRTTVLMAIALVMLVMMTIFRAHQPTLPQPAPPTPFHQTVRGPRQSATPSGPPATQPGPPPPPIPNVAPPPLPSPLGSPPGPGMSAGGAGGTAAPGNGSEVTVVGAQPQQQSTGLQVVVPPQAQQAGLVIVPGTTAGETGNTPGGSASGSSVQIVTPQAPPQGTAQDAGAAPPAATAATEPQPQPPSFQVGDQFTVKMLTPLAVSPAWQAIPAIAQGVKGPLSGWRVLGSASLGQDGSIQVTWTQALAPNGKTTVALHGIAYDPQEGKPGIPHAQTQIMAPQAARTALSGTLGAVSQYVQDEIQQQQLQVVGITGVLTTQVPPFWQIAAQQLATGFQPAPVQTGGTIVVARVPAGTPVVVMITAAGS